MQAIDRIILALDVDTETRALHLVDKLKDHVGAFKVGMQLFNSAGPQIVEKINSLGGKVFVDLKLHDIPNTVGAAGRVLTRLKAHMFNVHAAGGRAMMSKLSSEVSKEAENLGIIPPLTLAVTVLTSISQQDLENDMFIRGMKIEELVANWALMAKESQLSGVVCSPREIEAIRGVCGSDFIIVTPGIRPTWASQDDQKRFTTPKEAIQLGADYIVIGRPIRAAQNPVEAASRIIEELEDL